MAAQRFADRRVVITGAASGVGKATAECFAAEGAEVYLTDINAEGVQQAVAALQSGGRRAFGGACNVADEASVTDMVHAAAAQLGGIDVLVNAAGVGRSARFEEIDSADWRRVLGINLDGPYFTMRAALPHLLSASNAAIVNVASIAGLRGQAYNAHYCASKAGLINLTRTIALEFASRGLRANCICPGGVMTPFVRNFIPREDFERNLVAYYSPPVPHKLATADAVARVIAFLASTDAMHINGAALVADDGTLA